jgi:phospholipid/cholesterol/gamma-HCH transport system permease protein
MSIRSTLESIGEYALLLRRVLMPPDRAREFAKEFSKEIYKLGVNSIWIVTIISLFIGAVIVMQIAYNINSPLLPRSTVGSVSREIIILEFSSTVICLILAGKVGSNIASEIGTMRITQQIDASILWVNSANFLFCPKWSLSFFLCLYLSFSALSWVVRRYVLCALPEIRARILCLRYSILF